MLFDHLTDKIRVFLCFSTNFGLKGSVFFAHFGLGVVASLNRFLDILLESSRSPSQNRQKNRIIRIRFPESSQHYSRSSKERRRKESLLS
jgi:hypothetical protein